MERRVGSRHHHPHACSGPDTRHRHPVTSTSVSTGLRKMLLSVPTLGMLAEMGRQVAVVLYVMAMVAVIVGVDFAFFRNHYGKRLTGEYRHCLGCGVST